MVIRLKTEKVPTATLTHRSKTFYKSTEFISTDQGNHYGLVKTNNSVFCKTKLCLVHYRLCGDNLRKKVEQSYYEYGFDKHKNCLWREGYDYCVMFRKQQWKCPSKSNRNLTHINMTSMLSYVV